MSSQPVIPVSSQMLSPMAVSGARPKISVGGLSINGVLLFVTSLLVVASGFNAMRPEIAGLRFHPYLAPMALVLPFILIWRLGDFPARIGGAMVVFVAIYVFSIFSGGGIAAGEIFKIGTALPTIVTCALMVHRRGDFVAGVLGLSIAIAVLAAKGLLGETALTGIDAMEGTNKNAYSLFALPAILMGGFICARMSTVPTFVKTILIVCTMAALAAIFMSLNRSGYLGAVLIGGMLFWDRRGKGLLVVGLVAALVFIYVTQFGSTAVFDARMKQTAEGVESDQHRLGILATCWELGLDNPVMGVSPQQLPFEIGRRGNVMAGLNYVDSHNVFAHLFAGSGVFCLLALGAVAWTLWYWKPRNGIKVGGRDDPLRDARYLLRMMLVLWFVRGSFTREILYNPSFCIALGLCIGFCILADTARESTVGAKPLPRALSPARALPRGA